MSLDFEIGDPSNPTGHALLYFTTYEDKLVVYATYLVVPPINIELAKYMPPMFASKVSLSDMENVSSIPLPPVPEKVNSLEYLRALAQSRNDDLIYGGTLDTSDVERMLYATSESAQAYLALYNHRPSVPVSSKGGKEEEGRAVDVGEMLYPLMSDRSKLAELAKLTGSLRYAVEGNDHGMAREVRTQMEALGRYLNEKFRVAEIIKAAETPGPVASKLSALYTERCYKLCDEDYLAVAQIEQEIERLKGG